MNLSGHMEKWGAGVLGVIALGLIVNLVVQFNRGITRPKPATRPHVKAAGRPAAKVVARKQKVSDELSRYDPLVNLDQWKEFEDRPLQELKRDPFDFVGGKAPAVVARGPAAPAPQAPAPPPPPPPATMKVMGYSEGNGGADEAMVELCTASCGEASSPDDQLLVVHAGDAVGSRYKVIKITPTVVTVADATLHQNVDFNVPQ